MGTFNEDILSFLRQNTIQNLYEEASLQQLPVTHPTVRATVVRHFNLGPIHHTNFELLKCCSWHSLCKGESSKSTRPGRTTLQ